MPNTEAGKRLASELQVEYRIDLIDAIEAEAEHRGYLRANDCDHSECIDRLDAIKFWRISGFSEGPHWDHAIVEAETEEEARDVLKSVLYDDQLEEVWEVLPIGSWRVKESVRPLLFVLGSGCR